MTVKKIYENKREVEKVYGDSEPSLPTVKYWIAEFKCDRTNIFGEECPVWTIEVTSCEMIEKSRIMR